MDPAPPCVASNKLESQTVGLLHGRQHDPCSPIIEQAAGAKTCLIEEQQCWPAHQRSRNCDALLLAA